MTDLQCGQRKTRVYSFNAWKDSFVHKYTVEFPSKKALRFQSLKFFETVLL